MEVRHHAVLLAIEEGLLNVMLGCNRHTAEMLVVILFTTLKLRWLADTHTNGLRTTQEANTNTA